MIDCIGTDRTCASAAPDMCTSNVTVNDHAVMVGQISGPNQVLPLLPILYHDLATDDDLLMLQLRRS